jgi:hypothetical protein
MRGHSSIDVLAGNFCARKEFADSMPARRLSKATFIAPELTEVVSFGLVWVLMKASVLERVGASPFDCSPGFSEDLEFCRRAREVGAQMFMAENILIRHVDVDRGVAYLPNRVALPLTGKPQPTPAARRKRTYGPAVDAASYGCPPMNGEVIESNATAFEPTARRSPLVPTVLRFMVPRESFDIG